MCKDNNLIFVCSVFVEYGMASESRGFAAFFSWLVVGSGNFVSRRLGARETEEASRMLATGFVYGVIAGILIAVLGHVFLKPLCVLLGSTPTILPYTEKYLGVILLGTPLMLPSLEDLQIIGAWKILVLRPPSCKTSVAAALEICCRKDTVATSHTDSG